MIFTIEEIFCLILAIYAPKHFEEVFTYHDIIVLSQSCKTILRRIDFIYKDALRIEFKDFSDEFFQIYQVSSSNFYAHCLLSSLPKCIINLISEAQDDNTTFIQLSRFQQRNELDFGQNFLLTPSVKHIRSCNKFENEFYFCEKFDLKSCSKFGFFPVKTLELLFVSQGIKFEINKCLNSEDSLVDLVKYLCDLYSIQTDMNSISNFKLISATKENTKIIFERPISFSFESSDICTYSQCENFRIKGSDYCKEHIRKISETNHTEGFLCQIISS